MTSLWGEDFNITSKSREKTEKILKKLKAPKKTEVTVEKQLKSKKLSVQDRLAIIKENVLKTLGSHTEDTLIIRDNHIFSNYIDKAIANGIIAIDTETDNSLDPLTCKLMGLCLYTPGEKQVYIPVNHTDLEGKKLPNQITEEEIKKELQRVIDYHLKTIFHNGKFDYQVIKCTCGIALPIYWDTMIGAKLLDENELSAGLKQQYISKINPEQEKYSIESLFSGVEYAVVDPEIFALYASTDSKMTMDLYNWQIERFNLEDNKKILKLAMDVEMPCVEVVAEMELQGVCFDFEYAKRLGVKYHNKLNELDVNIQKEISKYQPQIDAWRLTPEANVKPKKKTGEGFGKSKNEQLENPINLKSPSQLAILLYDILKVPVVDKEKPRGTGVDELEKMKLPLCKLILERRGIDKLLDAFIDTIPQAVNKTDGRVHTHFNQYGARTGRFSSSDPVNLQNIPSHNPEIRMLFTAAPGYVFVENDLSQQEPRTLSFYSQDENMLNAYKNGKDLYATIASGVYHNKYEDNLEHYSDGTTNPEGKKRRTSCKSILLGIMYGRGANAIAEQTGSSIEEAQGIIDNFYKGFPAVKKWMDNTKREAKRTGYVEDWYGRRRRLPDIQLPRFTIKDLSISKDSNFNPFLECEDRPANSEKIDKYTKLLKNAKSKSDVSVVIKRASMDRVLIIDNSGTISHAERECVNARIQGGCSTMVKMAMNKIYRNEELTKLGFRLAIQVHDEVIGECPAENKERVSEIVSDIMRHCVKDYVTVPFKSDSEIEDRWYSNTYSTYLKDEYTKYKKDLTDDQAFDKIVVEHPEMLKDELKEIIYGQEK